MSKEEKSIRKEVIKERKYIRKELKLSKQTNNLYSVEIKKWIRRITALEPVRGDVSNNYDLQSFYYTTLIIYNFATGTAFAVSLL